VFPVDPAQAGSATMSGISGKGQEKMQSSYTARLVASAALLLASAGAILPPTASATTRVATLPSPAAQATPVPLELPAAPGEADVSQDTGAGRSASTVDFAPGETGTDQQDPSEFVEGE
jgi:hypothetical protein